MLITTYNRTPLLRRSLEALNELTWPDELIVIDDGGDDGCDELCAEYPIIYVYNHRPFDTNPCQARNVGIRMASWADILTCEPEVMFLTDVVAEMAAARKQHPDHVLYGWTYHANGQGSEIADSERIGHFPFYTLYRKSWLFEVRGYDEAFPEPWGFDDTDLNGRLAEIGHNQLRIDECEAFHQWHPSRVNLAVEQERHARAKTWPDDIVANKTAEWGAVLCR